MQKYIYKVSKVTKVVDGDTIKCLIDVGFGMHIQKTLRLLYVDTNELRSKDPILKENAYAAKKFLANALKKKFVYIETIKNEKTGKYGRLLAVLYSGDSKDNLVNLNDALVENGFQKKGSIYNSTNKK